MAQYPHVRVAGTAEQRGRQYGEQARERVRRSVSSYRDVFLALTGWDWDRVRREAARFDAPIAEYRPQLVSEMRGIADGAGLDYLDVLAINVRTEAIYAAKARQAAARTGPAECSSFAVVPAPGHAGLTLVGQNWDWLPHATGTVVVLEARQDDAPDYVTVVEAGLLAKTGMNSAGLGLATNALVTADDIGAPGLPYHVLLRAILDCENVSDAIAALQAGFRSSSANYLLAHRDGVAVDVEAAPGDFERLYFLYPDSDNGTLLHTNHFLSDRFARRDVSVWAMPDSPVRLQRLRAGMHAAGEQTVAAVEALLSDHANHPAGLCCHVDMRLAPADQGMTVASVLMDLSNMVMRISDGYPCSTPYREVDYASFLAKPPQFGAGSIAGPVMAAPMLAEEGLAARSAG